MEPGPCAVCGQFAHNGHHRKMRSQGGGEEFVNIIRLCGSGTTGCHGLVHANPEAAYEAGLLVHSWDDPAEVEVDVALFVAWLGRGMLADDSGRSLSEELIEERHAVPEGQECPTCHRRVPHKKKKSSPQTKVKAFRVPVDEVETFDEQLEAGAKYLGCYEKPHWQFWLWQYALVALLQSPELEGALKEQP